MGLRIYFFKKLFKPSWAIKILTKIHNLTDNIEIKFWAFFYKIQKNKKCILVLSWDRCADSSTTFIFPRYLKFKKIVNLYGKLC